MTLAHLRRASCFLLAAATAFGGLAIVVASLARQAPGPSAPASPPAAKVQAEPAPKPAETLAWRRTDRYEPPDFDRFSITPQNFEWVLETMSRLVIAYGRGELPLPGHDYRWASVLERGSGS